LLAIVGISRTMTKLLSFQGLVEIVIILLATWIFKKKKNKPQVTYLVRVKNVEITKYNPS